MLRSIRRVLRGSVNGIRKAWGILRSTGRFPAGEHDTSPAGTSADAAMRRTAEAALAEAAELREIERKAVAEHESPAGPEDRVPLPRRPPA